MSSSFVCKTTERLADNINNPYCITLLKPGTLLNTVRSPMNRLFGLKVALFCSICLACDLRVHGAFRAKLDVGVCGVPPLLQLEAEELPDVVDSVSTLAATTGLAITLESNCERKPRLNTPHKDNILVRSTMYSAG